MFDGTKSASSLTYERDTDLVTGMIQTIYNRLEKLDPDLFDLVIIDEAHHAMAPTWRKTAEHFKSKLRLGLSATPERLDGAPLDTLFEEITFNYTLKEAIDNDYLSKPKYQAIPT